MVYSDAFKNKMIERMLIPNARPVSALALDTGVSESRLYEWRNKARLKLVPADHDDDNSTTPTKPPHGCTAEEKVATVLEAAAIPDAELGAFLRAKGLHEAQLVAWRKQVTEAAVLGLRGPSGRDRKVAIAEARRVQTLERELKRKDKALAEAAALLLLKKKVQALWGDEGDDTTPENDE
ncbi:MAG: transposase [Kofleriaceae bacterium]